MIGMALHSRNRRHRSTPFPSGNTRSMIAASTGVTATTSSASSILAAVTTSKPAGRKTSFNARKILSSSSQASIEEALDVVAVTPVEAAIIDLVLPDGNGVDLCRRLREWSAMPIIVLSAVGEEQEKVRALDAGADDYVTTPFAGMARRST